MFDAVTRRVAQKEVRLFFSSAVAWLFLGGFAASTLFAFFWGESFFARNVADVRPLFQWMPLLLIFLCSALTMRTWSEERGRGTLEHVLTQPVGISRFVLGKFYACMLLLILALLTTTSLPVTVGLMANLDWGPVAAGYVAALLLGACYLSIGLFVSASTDNPIVSLIGAVALCGLLYLVGSPFFTGFFADDTGRWLRALGTGSRFTSITRGVLDLRDLLYYLTVSGVFLTLNVYLLERGRWSHARSTRHRFWRALTALLLLNLVLANVWMHRVPGLRLDVTEGKLYTLSPVTRQILQRLEEPLLIHGYFSSKTHPLLAPLAPELQDLLREYEIASGGKIKVEFLDPAQRPDLEQAANEDYGISATPFQVADRHQSSLVSAYFNVLLRYGGEYETLDFKDLIEVRTAANSQAEVKLRNPEYDLTRAIRDVLYSYQVGGALFEGIDRPVELVAYVSEDAALPPLLLAYKASIRAQLEALAESAGDKFSVRFVEPEANGGAEAQRIQAEWGFKPLVTALGGDREFFFYLTLEDDHQVVQLPTDNFDPDDFRATLEAGLKRFADGLTRTVALAVPPVQEQLMRHNIGAPTFRQLERMITRDYSIRMERLEDGSVDPEADILAVVAPQNLSPRGLYAIDQFLMRGGTLILATSPYTVELSSGEMRLQPWSSGLGPWLAHHGIEIAQQLVMDSQNVQFPAPVIRESAGYEFRDVQLVDYPYLIDLRPPGLNAEHPITASLPQLTMAWASPLAVESRDGRRIVTLLRSSPDSKLSRSGDITPRRDASGDLVFAPGDDASAQRLGVIVEGRFTSWFSEHPLPEPDEDASPGAELQPLVQHSPDAARIILFGSNDFLDDQMLNAGIAASGTQYHGPLELFMNSLDWALQDDMLLNIRARGHFSRTLPPMDSRAQAAIEYLNYGAALAWLLLFAAAHWLRGAMRRRHYRRVLGR